MTKKAITVRLDAALLADLRRCAAEENRTLTNYIETRLKHATAPRAEPVQAVLPDASLLAAVPILLAKEPAAEAPGAVDAIDTVAPLGEA